MDQGQTESASKMALSSVDDQRCHDDANGNTKRKAVNSGRQGSQRHIKESKSIIKTEITSGGDKCCQVIALKKLNSNINSNSLRKKYVDGSEKVVPRGQTDTRTDRRTRQSERCKKQRKLDDSANDASSDDQIQSDILNEKIAKHTTIVKTRVNGTECSKYRCDYCKKWTTNVALKGKMLAHLTKHEDGVLRCVHCGHDSVSVRALAEHVARAHTHKPQFVCALCGKACFCHKQLRQHEDIHNLHPRVCDHCGQTMHSLEQLKKHIKTEHGGDGLYSCDECRKTFVYQKWFDAHKVRQACGLKATCSVCGAEVVKGAGLSAHMRRVHAGEKRVPCSYCSYRAFTKTQVRLHERTHTRDYPFSCHLCAFSAAKKYQLTSHMRTHTGEKPFRCEQCPFASSWNIQLRTHQAAHTSATAVTCPVCSVVCKDARSLRMHKIREHAADRKLTEPMTAQAKPSAGGEIRRTRSSELDVTSTGPCPQDAHGREVTLEQTVARSGEVTSYIIVDETVAKDIERMGLETVSLVLLDGATVVPRNPASGDETASKHVPGHVDGEPVEVKDIERPSSDRTVEESELKCDTTATGTLNVIY